MSRRAAVLMIPLLVFLAGCGSSEKDITGPSQYNRGKLCGEFADFYKTVLSIDVEYPNQKDFDKPVSRANGCFPSHVNGGMAGHLDMVRSLEDGTDEPSDPAYQPQNGFDEKVWMAPGSKFRVQDGRWVGTMELFNTDLNNDQTRKAIEFLVKATREVKG
ncbi:hypothetical protein VMT65_12135 [Nocardia sp. CDC153]|uniref:hypothetical protein n=1 Tax=Nocardia sp. CDC153 TaxID=3112167 RepID=UPI002DB8F459|nr:hypothetical protein [Nocardia sp. CDC153]MEC3953779.1 hypothetical protein [Nocardia sp. CDC153]